VQELEDTVEALRRVVDKMKAENLSLRQGATSNQKYMEAVKNVKELRRKCTELEQELAPLKKLERDHRETLSRLARADEQVVALRRQLRRAESGEGGDTELRAALQHQRGRTEELERELAHRAEELTRVQRRLDAAGAGEGGASRSELADARQRLRHAESTHATMVRDLRELEGENAALRSELSALSPAFFDEVEDLKLAHHELQQRCAEYERQLGIARR